MAMSAGPGAPPSERRAFRRAALDRPVLVQGQGPTATARTVDLSGGGLALRLPAGHRGLAPEARVQLYFELPIGYAVETEGVVVRESAGLVAVRFVDTARESLAAIRSYCRLSGQHPTVQPRTLVPVARSAG